MTTRPRIYKPIADGVHPLVEELLCLVEQLPESTAAFADRAGYAPSTFSAWRSAHAGPTLSAFCDVAEALGYELVLVPKGEIERVPKGTLWASPADAEDAA